MFKDFNLLPDIISNKKIEYLFKFAIINDFNIAAAFKRSKVPSKGECLSNYCFTYCWFLTAVNESLFNKANQKIAKNSAIDYYSIIISIIRNK